MGQYQARANGRLKDEDANVVGNYIEEHFPVSVTPKDLLKVAEDPDNPLHRFFEWDDTKAAAGFRLAQASELLCSIIILEEDRPVRAFHSVYLEEIDKREFVSLDSALNSPPLWKQVVDKALKEAMAWKERYKLYQDLSPIVSAIEKTSSKLKTK